MSENETESRDMTTEELERAIAKLEEAAAAETNYPKLGAFLLMVAERCRIELARRKETKP